MSDVLDLEVSRWGDGERTALVIHGISSNSAGWWRLGPDLASLGYRVVAPDLRGHGLSPRAEMMSIDHYRDDILALGDRWDLVLGHSLGGAIALAAVEERPDLAGRLILQEPAVIGLSIPEIVGGLVADYEAPLTGERVAADNPRWHPTDAEIKAEALRQSGPEVVHRTVGDGAGWNFWHVLEQLKMPTLLIGADPELGAFIPPLVGEAAAASNRQIEFVTIRGGSHSMHRDEYDRYWSVVRRFAT